MYLKDPVAYENRYIVRELIEHCHGMEKRLAVPFRPANGLKNDDIGNEEDIRSQKRYNLSLAILTAIAIIIAVISFMKSFFT
jgi:hypothetical protein